MQKSTRKNVLISALVTFACSPLIALAQRRVDVGKAANDKRAFIAACDESISIDRLSGAPFKFIGKKVDLHGVVGPPMEDTSGFNLDSDNSFVAVLGDAKNLEEGQSIRVLGVVQKPTSGQTTTGGSGTFAVVRAVYMS